MHMNKKIKHPHKIGISMWFSQLHASVHKQNQQQYLISTMCITTTLINTHNSYKIHSQISQIHEQNILQTQNHNLKSPIEPIILSHSHNKQTLNTEQKVIFQPQSLPNYSLKKPTHVFLKDFLLSPHGRNLRKTPSNPLQKLIFIRLQSYSLMN